MSKAGWFLVVSDKYIGWGGYSWEDGPPEYVCDVAYVRAASQRRARVLAVRFWRNMNKRGIHPYRKYYGHVRYKSVDEPGENPFRGMKVERLQVIKCRGCGTDIISNDGWCCDCAPEVTDSDDCPPRE